MKYKLTIREMNVEGAEVYYLAIHFTSTKSVFHIMISRKHFLRLKDNHNLPVEDIK